MNHQENDYFIDSVSRNTSFGLPEPWGFMGFLLCKNCFLNQRSRPAYPQGVWGSRGEILKKILTCKENIKMTTVDIRKNKLFS